MTWLLRFLFKWTFPFFEWLAPSLCGKDGLSSSRKISSFIFMIMIVSTTSKLVIKDNPTMMHVYVLGVLVSTYLLLIGILTAQNLMDIWKNGKKPTEEKS